jgi:hypothetical protein
LAKYEDQVIASAIVLPFQNKLYGWDRVGFRAYYPLNPNNLLDWTLIEWGASNGLMEYDMMGANIPSITLFKLSFGGELRTYIDVHKEATWRACVGRRFYLLLMPHIRRVQFKLRSASALLQQ